MLCFKWNVFMVAKMRLFVTFVSPEIPLNCCGFAGNLYSEIFLILAGKNQIYLIFENNLEPPYVTVRYIYNLVVKDYGIFTPMG